MGEKKNASLVDSCRVGISRPRDPKVTQGHGRASFEKNKSVYEASFFKIICACGNLKFMLYRHVFTIHYLVLIRTGISSDVPALVSVPWLVIFHAKTAHVLGN